MFSKDLFAAAALVLAAAPASAATLINAGPPAGGVQLVDMANIAAANGPSHAQITTVATRFVATSSKTRFSFLMRADSSVFFDEQGDEHATGATVFLDNVALELIDPATGGLGGNLIVNGGFQNTDANLEPTNWIFDQSDKFHGEDGFVTRFTPIPGPPVTTPEGDVIAGPNSSFFSESNDQYNALSQTLATKVGTAYELIFTVAINDRNPLGAGGIDTTNFERVASVDSSGRQIPNGLDLVVTATKAGAGTHDDGHVHFSVTQGGGVADGVPEPSAWALMIVGFGGVGAALRRRVPAVAR